METEVEIIQQVRALFSGADERDWKKSESAMHQTVLLDYSSMSGSPASKLSPQEITKAWASFLPGFDRTQHQLSNFIIHLDGERALAQYEGKANHYIGKDCWVVEGSYDTKLEQVDGNWLITEHKFNFSKQSGNTNLPAVVREKMKKEN